MSEITEIKTLEELIEVTSPKTVFIAVEKEDHPIGDEEDAEGKADHAVRAVSITERVLAQLDKCEVINRAVIKVTPKEGDAVVTNQYAFVDVKQNWTKALTSDIAFVYRLDGKIEIIRGGDVKPYTLLD
ncbi:hypothetical protein YUBABA_01490 [Serratia phage vB_SmaM-Yubaba]|nr:hypothetical protein SUREIYA_00880 [Serratia phage vB_SmaM-Sureiya]UQT03355.1 hypothetical protein YUBABA_01490 [Serratia phage vB_SmaM-Yubaba]